MNWILITITINKFSYFSFTINVINIFDSHVTQARLAAFYLIYTKLFKMFTIVFPTIL